MQPKTAALLEKYCFIVKALPDVFVFIIHHHGGHIDRGFAVKRVDAQSW